MTTKKTGAGPARAAARKTTTTHEVQALAEGVSEVVGDGRKVEFLGGEYAVAERVGLMPLLKFAHASSKGLDSNDMEGLAALYAMIRDCIAEHEWARFERDAIDKRAESDDLMGVVSKVIEILAARPTRPPADSSAGRQPTSASLKASSSSPGTEALVPVRSLTARSRG